MITPLKIAVIQDNPTVGALAQNAAKILSAAVQHKDADLVVFPECFLTGYPLGDLVLRPGFMRDVEDAINQLRRAATEDQGLPAILFGAPQSGPGLPYNAAYLIESSGRIQIAHKIDLPNDDVFDEHRTFASGSLPAKPMEFRGYKLGVMICEDMWHGRVARSLADEMADVLIVLNGSPYEKRKTATRLAIARRRASTTGLPLIYANQLGGQDELVFDGASFAMNPQGGHLNALEFAPDVLRLKLTKSPDGTHIEGDLRDEGSIRPPFSDDVIASDYKACVLALQDYMAKNGQQKAIVGVSGGLDSALVLTMACDAIGAKNVVGVMMPSAHTGEESLSLADELMVRLGVLKLNAPISDAVHVLDTSLAPAIATMVSAAGTDADMLLTRENYQARMRGVFLMGISNACGGIVLSTGNKSEMAVGYSTLYGDMNGGFNPLKSVYKSEAFKMAAWRNANSSGIPGFADKTDNPIPEGIITRPPTAELSDGQTDAKSLGDYAALDFVLKAIIERRLTPAAAAKEMEAHFGLSEGDLPAMILGMNPEAYARRIAAMVRRAQYKRVQAAPGVKLNSTDFGLGWRYPIAGNYDL